MGFASPGACQHENRAFYLFDCQRLVRIQLADDGIESGEVINGHIGLHFGGYIKEDTSLQKRRTCWLLEIYTILLSCSSVCQRIRKHSYHL